MDKLKLFFALLLMAAGVHTAWAQTYMLGNQVTDVNQLSTEKLYAFKHINISDGTHYDWMFVGEQKSGSTDQYNLLYKAGDFPATDNKNYVWKLHKRPDGKYYLKNVGMHNCYILPLTEWAPSYAGTAGTKGQFTIESTGSVSYPNTFKVVCSNYTEHNNTGTYNSIGGMSGGSGDNKYPNTNNLNGVCGDEPTKHVEYIYEVNVVDGTADYSVCAAAKGRVTRTSFTNRWTTAVSLAIGDNTQTINEGLQTRPTSNANNNSFVYFDKTGTVWRCNAGVTITPSVTCQEMNGMQACFYLDENGDGFSYEADDDNHKAILGSDLKSFSAKQYGSTWYNSLGTATGKDIREMPAFTAPSTPGRYRVRYIVNWDSFDPAGTSTIGDNGGIIVDVTLEVLPPHAVSYVNEDGTVLDHVQATLSNGSVPDAGTLPVGASVATFTNGASFQALTLVSIQNNAGNSYGTWEELNAAVTAPTTLKVTLRGPVRNGGYYKIKKVTNDNYMQVGTYIDPTNTSNRPANSLIVGGASTAPATTDLFRLEEAGNGKYYIYNVGTGRYLKNVNKGTVTQTIDTEAETGSKGLYYISNLTIPGHTEYFALADANRISDPTTHENTDTEKNAFLHNSPGSNSDTKVVGWSQSLAVADNATTNGNSLWQLESVSNLNSAVKFNTVDDETGEDIEYWATFYSDFAVAKPAGTTMYYATYADENNKYLHLETLGGNVIPANFAVILKSVGEGSKQYVSVANNSDTEDVAAAREANKLQGTCNANDLRDNARVKGSGESGQVYVLSGNADEGMGFFRYTYGYLPQYKAYYVHPISGSGQQDAIRGFMFYTSDGTATRIDLNPAEGTDTVVFDLSGRRVTGAKNGLYIVNGKKVRL